MNNRYTSLTVLAVSSTVLLPGCSDTGNSADSNADTITVTSTADSCEVSADSVESGAHTFTITNEGDKVTEFYLLGSDGLRIVSELENIAPGSSAELTVAIPQGDYYTACKPGLRGANIGQASFTVTGEALPVSESDQELFDGVVNDYIAFVKNEVSELVPNVETFAQAYMDGNDAEARDLYATTRINYERIEPIAEALGTLDPRIDYREVDYLAEADQLEADDPEFTQWTGFHRIEKDLWPPAEGDRNADGAPATEGWTESSPEERQFIGQSLIDDVNTLYDTVNDPNFIEDQEINISSVSNGAISLLEEVAVTKVTGEENWWSHYDLWDFQANIQGSRIAFDLVAPIAEGKGDEGRELVEEINRQFDDLQALLDEYGDLDSGFTMYDEVTAAQQAELTRKIDALREPLSRLTGTVLGIEG